MKIALTTTPALWINDEDFFTWRRKRNKVFCTFSSASISLEHYSVCKHGDEFEFIFGMRKSMENLFRKHPEVFNREMRTKAYDRFHSAYGLGVCEPRPTVEKVEIDPGLFEFIMSIEKSRSST